jgi:prepilin-type N-terminal cleavage/methylation domain-containing protein/prepilin-type processing-associated H-X9-DG protein
MHSCRSPLRERHRGARGFSLPELLVVVGIIALLLAILLPPLKLAHRQAKATRCQAQLQQIGIALIAARNEYGYYPLWDDGGSPIRHLWLDVLIQRRYLGDERVAHCPDDPSPSMINAARGLYYHVFDAGQNQPGITYSYGIGVPLSSGAWSWRSRFSPNDSRPRRFENYERYTSQRILAADSSWSTVYNLSGDALFARDWSYPTRYDNTIDYRHTGYTANALLQDGHVTRLKYNIAAAQPVNTARNFVWYPGETLHVGPEDAFENNWYPNVPPVNMVTGESDGTFPNEMVPGYYTHNLLWTVITR